MDTEDSDAEFSLNNPAVQRSVIVDEQLTRTSDGAGEELLRQDDISMFALEVLVKRVTNGHGLKTFRADVGEIYRTLDEAVLGANIPILSPHQLHTQSYSAENVSKIAQSLVADDDWRILKILVHVCGECRVRSLRYAAADLVARIMLAILQYESDHGLEHSHLETTFRQFAKSRCKDVDPFVRTVVLQALTKAIHISPTQFKPEEYLSVFGIFITDAHRSVRICCVTSLSRLLRLEIPQLIRESFQEKYLETLVDVANLDPVVSVRTGALVAIKQLYLQSTPESTVLEAQVLVLLRTAFVESGLGPQSVVVEAASMFWKLSTTVLSELRSSHARGFETDSLLNESCQSSLAMMKSLARVTEQVQPEVASALLNTSSKTWKSIYDLLMVDFEANDMDMLAQVSLAMEILGAWIEAHLEHSPKSVDQIISAISTLLTRYENNDQHLFHLIELVGKVPPQLVVADEYHALLEQIIELFVSRPSDDVVDAVGTVLALVSTNEQHSEWLREYVDRLWDQVSETSSAAQLHQLTALAASLPKFPEPSTFRNNLCVALLSYISAKLQDRSVNLVELEPLVTKLIQTSFEEDMVVDMEKVLYVVGGYAALVSGRSMAVPKVPDQVNGSITSLLDGHVGAQQRGELIALARTIMGLWHFDVISMEVVDTLRQAAGAYAEEFPELGSIVSSSM